MFHLPPSQSSQTAQTQQLTNLLSVLSAVKLWNSDEGGDGCRIWQLWCRRFRRRHRRWWHNGGGSGGSVIGADDVTDFQLDRFIVVVASETVGRGGCWM